MELLVVVIAVAGGLAWAVRASMESSSNRRVAILVTEAIVIGSIINVTIQTHRGETTGETTNSDSGTIWMLGVPAVLCVALARGRLVTPMTCVLALLAWAPLNLRADLSCTDCGFALLIPFSIAIVQVVLLVASIGTGLARRRRGPVAGP